MPIMDGIEATREILKLYEKREAAFDTVQIARPCIIALTANDTAKERVRCLNAGMSVFLSKPPVPEELNRVIANIFGEEHVNGDLL